VEKKLIVMFVVSIQSGQVLRRNSSFIALYSRPNIFHPCHKEPNMSKLQDLKNHANLKKKFLPKIVSFARKMLANFLGRNYIDLGQIFLKIHGNQITKIIRTHITNFDMDGNASPNADPINVELRRILNSITQFFENEYGYIIIVIENGIITDVQPAPLFKLKDFELE
jgi:hypothetical protein